MKKKVSVSFDKNNPMTVNDLKEFCADLEARNIPGSAVIKARLRFGGGIIEIGATDES